MDKPEKFIMGALLISIALIFVVAFSEGKRKQYMLEKCTPDPTQWECQVYLAEKGQQAIQSSAMGGAMIGGIIGSGLRK